MPNTVEDNTFSQQWKTNLAWMNNWGVWDSTGMPFGNVLGSEFKKNEFQPYL